MLYLMMDRREPNKSLVKVGVSRDVSARRRQYTSHNPYAIMRSQCAGTENAELHCHRGLSRLGQRVSGTEWFTVSDTVFQYLYEKGMGAFFNDKRNIYFCGKFD